MSKLVFDGDLHELVIEDGQGRRLGAWVAFNNVDRHATLRALSDGTYQVLDQTAPHAHPANPNGPFGSYGIIRFNVPGHVGIGVHSGRANASRRPGPPHWTMGCIRTSDEAMRAIVAVMGTDPLTTIEVVNNNQASAQGASLRLGTL